VLEVGADRIRLTDGKGRPLLTAPGAHLAPPRVQGLTPPPVVRVPFSLGNGFFGGVGLFLGLERLAVVPDPKLAALLAGGTLEANQRYAVTARGGASAGASLDFSYAVKLPPLPEVEGSLYLGVRGEAFLGLARIDARTTLSFLTDSEGKPSETKEESRIFYSYLGHGVGYGARLDVGLAYANEVGVFGLGVRNLLGFSQWQGTEVTRDEGGSREAPRTETFFGFSPAVYLNGAGYLPLEEGGPVLLAADLGYDGAISAPTGVGC